MARIFITGSSDGIGLLAAQSLIKKGHSVTLHARSPQRAAEAQEACPGSAGVLIGNLSSISATKDLALEANKTGKFDTVIHNAGVGLREGSKKTEDGISHVFAVNALAPYILTALMERPRNLVYVSSELHASGDAGGDAGLEDKAWRSKVFDGGFTYHDSKLMNVIFAFGVARHWPDVASNALTPGWVKTKLGGSSAPGSAARGAELVVRLGDADPKEIGTGQYFGTSGVVRQAHRAASDEKIQEQFLKVCEEISGVPFPK